jgi:hypothetical protein
MVVRDLDVGESGGDAVDDADAFQKIDLVSHRAHPTRDGGDAPWLAGPRP